ncbi:SAF domain-containing protein [Desulforamulus ruminis]|uniref:SAF domain-containing protein n=1 Tax=Desulforamulus ruminis TaxID=1564 RepID=UPI002FDADD6A
MSRKKGIMLAVILTLVFTFLIVAGANSKNMTKKVEVLRTKATFTFGDALTEKNVEVVKIPEELAKGMVNAPDELKGKTLVVPVGKDQYLYKDHLRNGATRRPGYTEVYIEVDLAKSALALPGEYVDLVPIDNTYESMILDPICKSVKVLHAVDNKGYDINPLASAGNSSGKGLNSGDKKYPVTVGLEIPDTLVTQVVPFADKKIQLVKGSRPEVP